MYKKYKKDYSRYLEIVSNYEPEREVPRIMKKPQRIMRKYSFSNPLSKISLAQY
mgnify:CR=1 FL=1